MEESLYETKSFFILSGLRKGSEFGIDGGPTYTVDRFEGVKFVPAGLHLFIFSSQQSPSTSSNAAGESEAVSNGVGIRCGLFRFFDDQREVVVEAWDNQREELEGDESRRVRRSENYVVEEGERTIISVDRLKALDSHLMPYPIENQVAWQHLVKFVTRNTLLRVLGVDQKGNFRADSIMSGSDEPELKEVRSQTSWGKARERDPMMGEERAEDDEDEQALEFMNVDKKRSWPSDASGAELSRWSIDKSYQLSNMISILGIGTCESANYFMSERGADSDSILFIDADTIVLRSCRSQGAIRRDSNLIHIVHFAPQLLSFSVLQILFRPHLSLCVSSPSSFLPSSFFLLIDTTHE